MVSPFRLVPLPLALAGAPIPQSRYQRAREMAGGFVRLAGVFLAFDSPALPALRLHLRVCVTLPMQGRCGGCILIVVPRMEYIRSSNSTPQERGVLVDKGGQVDHQVHHITCETMSVQPRADPIRDVGSDELRAQQMRARRGLVLLASDVGTEIDKVQCDGRAVQVGFVNQALSVVYFV
ncbi:hypothetical protein CCUS01_00420 [Colletotrichum cuscutae]|uniref:Uncharacterized protein n=1 Tax=Colletotrichum cuscutae TaxID=1209917 RepID=A0AAI9VB81_9PEZI|nr:hypothetical protein CCUS01_00420 [Colletotrichum cuscutae]